MADALNVPTSQQITEDMQRDRDEAHAQQHPDGCPDWCARCQLRLMCKDGRHEWPRDFSDGDTCFCGAFYLVANGVDERPHIEEAPAHVG